MVKQISRLALMALPMLGTGLAACTAGEDTAVMDTGPDTAVDTDEVPPSPVVDLVGPWHLPLGAEARVGSVGLQGANCVQGMMREPDSDPYWESDGEPITCEVRFATPDECRIQLVFDEATIVPQARFRGTDCHGRSGWVRLDQSPADWTLLGSDGTTDRLDVQGTIWEVLPLAEGLVDVRIADFSLSFSLTRDNTFEP